MLCATSLYGEPLQTSCFLNRVFLGMQWSGILARCPSHSRWRFMSLTVMISWSPHCSLVILEVILSSHCLMLVIPSTVQMQRWWNALSCFRCFLSTIQHSPPYCSTESTQVWYTYLLVVSERLVLVKTAFRKAPNALEALARRLSTSPSI